MKTIGEVLQHCAAFLERKGVERARREAEDLLSDALGMKRVELYMQHDRPLTEAELTVCRARLVRRARGEPLAYIHGEVEFYGCRIQVTPDVLIPRQETALLAERIARALEKEELVGKSLWDICCGSGCLGISLKKRFPSLHVIVSDVSRLALEIARRNAALNGVEVEFRQGDLLQPFVGQQTHFIVCNPPYVSESDYQQLSPEVRDFEPKQALVAGPDGLDFYRRLAKKLPAFLLPHGHVWLEIGHGQGKALAKLFPSGLLQRDWAGLERFFEVAY